MCLLLLSTFCFGDVGLGAIIIMIFFAFFLQLDPPIKEAFDVAYNNIYAFHSAQKSPEKSVENMKVCLCSCL